MCVLQAATLFMYVCASSCYIVYVCVCFKLLHCLCMCVLQVATLFMYVCVLQAVTLFMYVCASGCDIMELSFKIYF